jgi:hypothetical protein
MFDELDRNETIDYDSVATLDRGSFPPLCIELLQGLYTFDIYVIVYA